MLRIAANLDLLFKDLPLMDRFAAAKDAGFSRVEMMSPYDMPIRDLDRALTRNHLELSLISTPMGDWDAGERGFMGVPRRIADFRQGFLRALEYAEALEVDMIHLMAGIADVSRAQKMLTRNLAWAAYNAPDRTLTLGPLKPTDVDGYAITGFDHALELIDWIGAPNLGLHFEAHYACQAGSQLSDVWAQYGARTYHLELTGAAFDEPSFLASLRQSGFEGLVSVETSPEAAA